jgi:ribosomal protein S18 acetylase RimI-like enzyme
MNSPQTPEEPVVATASRTQEALSVRSLRETDAFDHDLVRRLAGITSSPIPRRHMTLPSLALADGPLGGDTLVACVDGLVVSRAVLEAVYPPYCELVNMGVRPDYRRRGVGTALVLEAQRRARATGFKYMALQTERDNERAYRFYESLGFLPAAEGEMRRMVALLDAPIVNLFRLRHAGWEFTSQSDEELGARWWRLEWRDGGQHVALLMFGGSCQHDSDGLLPTVRALEVRDQGAHLSIRADAPDTILTGEPGKYPPPGAGRAEVRITVRNLGETEFVGSVRAVLLPDLEVPGCRGAELPELRVEPGDTGQAAFCIAVQPRFSRDAFRFTSYPSVPLTAEVCWAECSVLLSAAAKIV